MIGVIVRYEDEVSFGIFAVVSRTRNWIEVDVLPAEIEKQTRVADRSDLQISAGCRDRICGDELFCCWRLHQAGLHPRRVLRVDPMCADHLIGGGIEFGVIVLCCSVEVLHLCPVERNGVAHVPAILEVLVIGCRGDINIGAAQPSARIPELIPNDGSGWGSSTLNLDPISFRRRSPVLYPLVEVVYRARNDVVHRKIAEPNTGSAVECEWPQG